MRTASVVALIIVCCAVTLGFARLLFLPAVSPEFPAAPPSSTPPTAQVDAQPTPVVDVVTSADVFTRNDPVAAGVELTDALTESTKPQGPDEQSMEEKVFASEPIDPHWSAITAAVLESVVASSGGVYAEMHAECRTTVCRIAITHNEGQEALQNGSSSTNTRKFSPALRPVVSQNSPRLDTIGVGTTPENWPNNLGGRLVTRIYLTGPAYRESVRKIREARRANEE